MSEASVSESICRGEWAGVLRNQPACRMMEARYPGFLGGLPPLPSPAQPAAQRQGDCRLAQDPRATGVIREGLGGVGFRNSISGTGMPEAEDLWKEQGQHVL